MDLKVLIIDDNLINRQLLSVLLKKDEEVKIILEAENGRDGLSKLENNKDIDIIFLDIVMPIMNGIDFLKELNSDYFDIPIIVMSTDDQKKEESLDNGASLFLLKPVKSERFLKEFNRIKKRI